MPQDLEGVSASAIRRQDTEPDVPAHLSELLGEPVSDRRTTDYSSAYFRDQEIEGFYPEAAIVFEVRDAGQHYHVPLLLSPYGYSTYRGS